VDASELWDQPRARWWADWVSVPISRRLTGSALVELNYDVEIPPWYAGPIARTCRSKGFVVGLPRQNSSGRDDTSCLPSRAGANVRLLGPRWLIRVSVTVARPLPCAEHTRVRRSGAARPSLDQRRWKKTAAWVKQRDDNRCIHCGATEPLVCHHLVRPQDGGTDETSNLVTLCRSCHGDAHVLRIAENGRATTEPSMRPAIEERVHDS
jgi:5-methylcytosine-specific restriction endonuclease McrA